MNDLVVMLLVGFGLGAIGAGFWVWCWAQRELTDASMSHAAMRQLRDLWRHEAACWRARAEGRPGDVIPGKPPPTTRMLPPPLVDDEPIESWRRDPDWWKDGM